MNDDKDAGPKRPGRLLVNLPPDLRKELERAAFVENRTLNAEITRRLRLTFDPRMEIRSERDPLYDSFLRATAKVINDADNASHELDAEAISLETELLEAIRTMPLERRKALLLVIGPLSADSPSES